MGRLKEVSQSLTGCFDFFKDALDTLELMKEKSALSEEIYEAITDKIFCVIEELDYCELFLKRLSECKTESEMESIINSNTEGQ